MRRAEAEGILLAHGWLAGQPQAFQRRFLALADMKTFGTCEDVYRAGGEGGGICGIAAGSFAVYVSTPLAPPSLAHILRSGMWFGYGPLVTRRQRTMTFSAVEASVVLLLPQHALRGIFSGESEEGYRLAALTEYGMDVAIQTISNLLIRDSDRRIAATLLHVTSTCGDIIPHTSDAYYLTQTQLGEMANVSRHIVNKTLSCFEQRGWVAVGYNKIFVLDPKALAAFAYD